MSSKITWIALLVTLTFWLGQLMGCASEQNYRVLEEDEPLFEQTDRPIPQQPGAKATPAEQAPDVVLAEPAENEAVFIEAEPVEAEQAEAEQAEAEQADAGQGDVAPVPAAVPAYDPMELETARTLTAADRLNALSDLEPSLHSLDRSDWPVIVVTPVSGAVEHCPVYFHDVRLWDEPSGVAAAEGTEERFAAALEAANADPLGDQLLSAFLQPAKFAFDVVALPVRRIMTPPWTTVTTP